MRNRRCAAQTRWIGVTAATLTVLFVVIIIGSNTLAQTGELGDPGVSDVPSWTGTIEVYRNFHEKPAKPKPENVDSAINWANARLGGIKIVTGEKIDNFKATVTIANVSADGSFRKKVTGFVQYEFGEYTSQELTQNVYCRLPGKSTFPSKIKRTINASEYTFDEDAEAKQKAKRAAVKIPLEEDVGASASVVWKDDGWHVKVYISAKQFKTMVKHKQDLLDCDGKTYNEDDSSFEGIRISDPVEFDANTRITNPKATLLAGGAAEINGKYNVHWILKRK